MTANTLHRHTFILGVVALGFSAAIFVCNYFGSQFRGNNYFPQGSMRVGLSLLLILAGCHFLLNQSSKILLLSRMLLAYYLVMAIIVLLTNAVQLTPFAPIDAHLIAMEARLSIHMQEIVAFTAQYPLFKKGLIFCYVNLEYFMVAIPVLMMLAGREKALSRFYFLLLFTALLGFTFYYFFPTTAPASMVNSPHFMDEQRATGLKFVQIHSHHLPQTLAGGLIALPSFHVIWAGLLVVLATAMPWLLFIVLPYALLVILSCVLLGWHYPVDAVAGLLLIYVGQVVLRYLQGRTVAVNPRY